MTLTQNPHALGIIASLEAASLTVGDGEGEKNASGEVIAPQVIVHLVSGGTLDGGADDPEAWGDVRFILMAVGRLAAEARYVADAAEQALIDNPVSVTGRRIQRVRPMQPWGPTERDHDVDPPLFYASCLFGMWSFPT